MTMTAAKAPDVQRPDVPRHDLIRGLMPMRAEDDGNTMVGYPVVFNQWTEINSWEGQFLERVLPSGPVQSLRQNKNQIKVQYNHGMHPVVGTSGLGRPRVMEIKDFGVYTETPLTQTSYNRDIIKPQLVDGTLDGMSFRFSVVNEEWNHPTKATSHNPGKLPERSIVEFKWYEFGPVDWAAYEATQAGIRSQAAFALWLQAPAEQRSAVMRQFDIDPSHSPRIYAPGWEPKTVVPDTEERDDEQESPAGADATEDSSTEEQPTESAGDAATGTATSEVSEEPTRDDEPTSSSSQPARISRERLDLTLDYVESRLIRSRARTDLFASRIDALERHLSEKD